MNTKQFKIKQITTFIFLMIITNANAQIRRNGFNPSIHGFKFANNFVSSGPINTSGLCGGMCLAAFNYFRYETPIPHFTNSDINFTVNYDITLNTAPGTNPVIDYIFHSQIATFQHSAIPWFFGSPFADTNYNDEFQNVRRVIDRNQFVILGLRGRSGNASHQVLCYGYDTNGQRLFVYDPNTPNAETVITATRTGDEFHVLLNSGTSTDSRFKFIFLTIELDRNIRSTRSNYDVLSNASLNFSVTPPFVPIPPSNYTACKHYSSTLNIIGNSTYIDNIHTNGNPNAKIFITPDYSNSNKNIGIWFDSFRNKWAIYNQDRTNMTLNRGFHVVISNDGLLHEANTTNTTSHSTYINHPISNNNPNALVFVTQKWNSAAQNGGYNNNPIGVWYDSSTRKWAIYNENFNAMGNGLQFNVLVTNPDSNSQAITVNNTGLISNSIISSSDSVVLLTHNYNPNNSGSNYLNSYWETYYNFDSNQWAIYSQSSTLFNTSFNLKKFSGCGNFSTSMKIADTKENTSKNQCDHEIKVYPNPTSNTVNIETKEKIEEVSIFELTTMKKIKTETEANINMSEFNTGFYLLEIKTNNKIYNHKVYKK